MFTEQKTALKARVEEALETVRPHLMVDGGDVEVVDITDEMELQIKWLGMCESCSMSAFTLRAGIEEAVRRWVPEILKVTAINSNKPALTDF
jgi:Fe-S cluster biogenesis protein NfuA